MISQPAFQSVTITTEQSYVENIACVNDGQPPKTGSILILQVLSLRRVMM